MFNSKLLAMKKLIYTTLALAIMAVIISCVDDYIDANPPRLKDGPFFKVSLSEDSIKGGETFNFTINVIDAPGGIDSVSISNPQNVGSYTLDNLDALKGKTTGEITGVYTSPTTFEGSLELNFELFDAQTDEKGEDASKGLSVKESIYVTFPDNATLFMLDAADTSVVRGESLTFDIVITDAPGGVDSVYASADNGEIEIDQADFNAIKGKSSGTVSATYISDEEFVGAVEVSVNVVDILQNRISTETIALSANYEFEAPIVDLSIDTTEFQEYHEIGLDATITAPGTVDTVMILATEVTTSGVGDTTGITELDTTELKNIIGTNGGTVAGTFLTDIKSYYSVKVTVVDEQGRATTDSVEVLVTDCEISDIEGTYRVVTSGESSSDPTGPYTDLVDTVEIAGDPGNVFEVSDLSFGLFEYQGMGEDEQTEPGTITICDQNILYGAGSGGRITVTSGTVNGDETIEINWENADGDSGSSVLTPINP